MRYVWYKNLFHPLFKVQALGLVALLTITACDKTGIQGGDYDQTFDGLEVAEAISPTAVRLSWAKLARYSEYNVYRDEITSPVSTDSFSTTVISGLSSNTTYKFKVTGVLTETGAEEGINRAVNVTTFRNFDGITSSNLTVVSPSRIDLSWTTESSDIDYVLYYKQFAASWDFSSPQATVSGGTSYSLTGLTAGTKYCFFLVASYEDNTSEPSTSDPSAIDSAPCIVTQTDLQNLPLISVNRVTPGAFPWFLARFGNPTFSTDVYRTSDDLKVASVNGNGAFRAFSPLLPGEYQYYAVVKSASGGQAQVTVDISEDPDGSLGWTTSFLREFVDSGSTGPVFPPLQSGGKGIQQLGTALARGDFNCDGLTDLAVSAPYATPEISSSHIEQMGAILVYYGYDPEAYIDPELGPVDPKPKLKTSPTPSPSALAPDPQVIYYPTGNLRLGSKLAVGNANGDCVGSAHDSCNSLYNLGENVDEVYSCDDLAATTNLGSVFVLFGSPGRGLVSGSGSISYGVNETVCDSGSNSCRAVQMSEASTTNFGKSIAFGDFNNDGFDDLAVGSNEKVVVLRGSGLGLYPSTASQSFPTLNADGFGGFTTLSLIAASPISTNDEFAFSLAPAPNSRYCRNNIDGDLNFDHANPTEGIDVSKCDDLIIGLPGRSSSTGSILACSGATTGGKVTSWACSEHRPTELVAGSRYGHSLLGVPNQNGHPLGGNQGTHSGAFANKPDTSGALYVGAPRMSVSSFSQAGKVYVYYMTPWLSDYAGGGIRAILDGPSAGTHAVNAQNDLACDSVNRNGAGGNKCEHQALFNSPAESGAQFGTSIGLLGNILDVRSLDAATLPWVAVSAPYKDVPSSDGSKTILDGGAVYVYMADRSLFDGAIDPIAGPMGAPVRTSTTTAPPTCPGNCTWLGGGISPFAFSVIYPHNLNDNANFGLGGIVGGNYNQENPYGDGGAVVAASQYHDEIVPDGGSVFLFYSAGGPFGASKNAYELKIQDNISKELNYHFEKAKVIGDINGDGYDDVMAHIAAGSRYKPVLYYGSSSGLITTPNPSLTPTGKNPLLISVSTDTGAGSRFYAIGSVNGDAFDDILLVGNSGSYIYYGSFAGLITGTPPQVDPVGKSPLMFAKSGTSAITLHGGNMYPKSNDSFSSGIKSTYDPSNQGVTHGDFNGDNYEDMAIGLNSNFLLPGACDRSLPFGAGNVGRVIIIYGSINGPQVNRTTGRITNSCTEVDAKDPCTGAGDPVCKIQVLSEPNGSGAAFGFSLASVQSLGESSGEIKDELLVGDPYYNSNLGRVYFYPGDTTGIQVDPAHALKPQIIVPDSSEGSEKFGYFLSSAGDINDDGYPDFLVGAPESSSANGHVYAFYTYALTSGVGVYGESAPGDKDFWTEGTDGRVGVKDGLQPTYGEPMPQMYLPISQIASSDYFGFGISGAGDLNLDGYNDAMINVASGDYNISSIQTDTGFALILFGGPNGLQISESFSNTPRCYGLAAKGAPNTEALCDPFLLYLPDREEGELTYVSSSAYGDINGDGKSDVLLGGLGRTHPSGLGYSVGVFYVLY